MKNNIGEWGRIFIEFANKFGLLIAVAIISMIARSIYKGTSIKRLLLKIPISAITGMVAGILLQEYTKVSTQSIIVICSIIGAYTGEVLEGLEQLIKWIPELIKKLINKNFNL